MHSLAVMTVNCSRSTITANQVHYSDKGVLLKTDGATVLHSPTVARQIQDQMKDIPNGSIPTFSVSDDEIVTLESVHNAAAVYKRAVEQAGQALKHS